MNTALDLLVDKWMTADYETLVATPAGIGTDIIRNSIYPSLLKSQQGYLAPQGDIKDGLHIGISMDPYNNTYTASVHYFDDDGNRQTHLTVSDEKTLPLLERFVGDFQDAVVMSENMRPLCVFRKTEKTGEKIPIGYMSYLTLKKLYDEKITNFFIGVP